MSRPMTKDELATARGTAIADAKNVLLTLLPTITPGAQALALWWLDTYAELMPVSEITGQSALSLAEPQQPYKPE